MKTKLTTSEITYGINWIASVILLLVGAGHFFFYLVAPNADLFYASLIGQIQSSIALLCIIAGAILACKAKNVRLIADSKNEFVESSKKMDARVYKTW